MAFTVATAVRAFCVSTIPQKPKYAICAIPGDLLFFLFNSAPSNGPTRIAMIEVVPEREPFLQHKSFLDTASLIPFEQQALDAAVKSGQCWSISHDLREAIKQKVAFHGQLRQMYESFVLANF